MKRKESAAGPSLPAADETQAGTVISSQMIPHPPANPIAYEVQWMLDFAAALDERTLASWALRLQDVELRINRRAYLWRELARLELRRRRRLAVM